MFKIDTSKPRTIYAYGFLVPNGCQVGSANYGFDKKEWMKIASSAETEKQNDEVVSSYSGLNTRDVFGYKCLNFRGYRDTFELVITDETGDPLVFKLDRGDRSDKSGRYPGEIFLGKDDGDRVVLTFKSEFYHTELILTLDNLRFKYRDRGSVKQFITNRLINLGGLHEGHGISKEVQMKVKEGFADLYKNFTPDHDPFDYDDNFDLLNTEMIDIYSVIPQNNIKDLNEQLTIQYPGGQLSIRVNKTVLMLSSSVLTGLLIYPELNIGEESKFAAESLYECIYLIFHPSRKIGWRKILKMIEMINKYDFTHLRFHFYHYRFPKEVIPFIQSLILDREIVKNLLAPSFYHIGVNLTAEKDEDGLYLQNLFPDKFLLDFSEKYFGRTEKKLSFPVYDLFRLLAHHNDDGVCRYKLEDLDQWYEYDTRTACRLIEKYLSYLGVSYPNVTEDQGFISVLFVSARNAKEPETFKSNGDRSLYSFLKSFCSIEKKGKYRIGTWSNLRD